MKTDMRSSWRKNGGWWLYEDEEFWMQKIQFNYYMGALHSLHSQHLLYSLPACLPAFLPSNPLGFNFSDCLAMKFESKSKEGNMYSCCCFLALFLVVNGDGIVCSLYCLGSVMKTLLNQPNRKISCFWFHIIYYSLLSLVWLVGGSSRPM